MRALIVVDLQEDFLPGGALAVPEGDSVIDVANQRMSDYPLVVATQDWHPAEHLSFASQYPERTVGETVDLDGLPQMLWPDHCVQETAGADFATSLNTDAFNHVVRKGTHRRVDSYSGFFDNARRRATGLEAFLREQGVNQVDILGLALDYCVKFTALDACDLGFETRLILDGCRGVEWNAGDCERAIEAMRDAGVTIV